MTSPATLPAGYNYSTQYVYDATNDVWRPQQADTSGNLVVAQAGVYNSTLPTLTNGQRSDLQVGARGSLAVQIMSKDGTVGAVVNSNDGDGIINGTGGALLVEPFTRIFNGTTWDRMVKPNSTFRLLGTAASTNSNNVKASAGNLFKIIVNVAVAGRFLKIYNKASAPTIGTDTPVLTIPLPGTGLQVLDVGADGMYFSAGIGFGVTGAIGDADTTAVAANDLTGINFIYS